jgi:hypothetical protein
LLATLATLALVVASAVGTYAHAAGHGHHHHALHAQHSAPHAAHQHDPAQGEAAQAAAEVDVSHPCDGHKPTGLGHSHADCCDTICHGGYAILSLAGDVSPVLGPAPFTALVTQGGGTRPGSLDRPPRAPVLA